MQQTPKGPGLFARIAAQIQAAAEAQAAAAQAAAQVRSRPVRAKRPAAPVAAETPRPQEYDAPPAAPPLLATFHAPRPFLSAFVLAEALSPPVALRPPEAARWT